MKKSLVASAVLGALAVNAQAESNVEIYGVFDIGVGYSQHSLSSDPYFPVVMSPIQSAKGDKSVTGLFNGGLSASRLGFKGSEDIGNGVKAIFTLEAGFNPNNGILSNGLQSMVDNTSANPTSVNGDSSMAGQLFGRQAFVGLSSAQWGTITFGRNYSLGSDVIISYDPMQGSQVFSPFGYFGSFGGGGFTEDFRIDNSVKYKHQIGPVNFGLVYKFGGQAGSTDAMSAYQATVGYDNGTFGIQGTYSMFKDGITATSSPALGQLNLLIADTEAWMIAAKYKLNQFLFRGGYERIELSNPSNPSFDTAGNIPTLFGYTVNPAGVTRWGVDNSFQTKKMNVFFGGVTYELSQAFNVTAAYYDIHQNDFSGGVCGTGAACDGDNRFSSVMADYKFSKRTDVYAGAQFNKVDGGFAPAGTLHNSNRFFGTGIRHLF